MRHIDERRPVDPLRLLCTLQLAHIVGFCLGVVAAAAAHSDQAGGRSHTLETGGTV